MFTSKEQLGETDPWYCPKCETSVQAFKKLDLWKLPNILVIHLKRFSYTKYSRDKLTVNVEFPLDDLQLDNFVVNEKEKLCSFSLFAVSNHVGSLGSGHYTAYCKNSASGEWYEFNDNTVQIIKNVKNVQSSNAYVLYYMKRE